MYCAVVDVSWRWQFGGAIRKIKQIKKSSNPTAKSLMKLKKNKCYQSAMLWLWSIIFFSHKVEWELWFSKEARELNLIIMELHASFIFLRKIKKSLRSQTVHISLVLSIINLLNNYFSQHIFKNDNKFGFSLSFFYSLQSLPIIYFFFYIF